MSSDIFAMKEIPDIRAKYRLDDISHRMNTAQQVNRYALEFYKDVTKVYRLATDQRNPIRNPTGYSLADAPVLGLLVRMWKLSTLVVRYFEQDNGEYVATFHRPLLEASVTAMYLLQNDDAVIRDYRRCSYKDTLRILRDYKAGSAFFRTRAGRRVLTTVRENLALEGLTNDDFSVQKRNGWRLQGKSFFRLFSEMVSAEEYAFTYGMTSESIHGSWNNSMDWCLFPNEDGTFSANCLFIPADVRIVSSAFYYATPAYRSWLRRVEADDNNLIDALNAIERVNWELVQKFNELFDGTVSATAGQDFSARNRGLRENTDRMKDETQEIQAIMSKYDEDYVTDFIGTIDTSDTYALTFYGDIVEICDFVTRLKHRERNPTGFSLNDAPILGLLIRTWKLLKQAIDLYQTRNAEFIFVVERSLIEAAVMATYLLNNDNSVVEDYRMCSYRYRLRILTELQSGSPFAATKPGQRLLKSIQHKLEHENLTQRGFATQEANEWRVQGKTFFDIFAEVVGEELYRTAYGTMSDSVHGSWLESVEWCLTQNEDGTFSARHDLDPAPIRFVSLLLPFTTPPFRQWVNRVQVDESDIAHLLNWIDKFNEVLLDKYDYLS